MIELSTHRARPLDRVAVTASPGGRIVVWDARGREIHSAVGERTEFAVSGAPGTHQVLLLDEAGAIRERASYDVDARTEIDDAGGRFRRLLYLMECTLEESFAKPKLRVCDGERVYRMHTITSRGAVHGVKGGRYFLSRAKDSPDLFAANQADGGMIWDFGTGVDPGSLCHFEWRWGPKFSKRTYQDTVIFARQPVMNDVEHVFIHGIYLAWQSTGDDEWMAGRLDAALRAVEYTRTSPYTWSDKFQLIHRPYCLDLWDFQSDFDAALVGGDYMDAVPGVTKFGVFYGDNLCMALACRKLALMLRHVGRDAEAEETEAFADHLITRTNEVAWNGEFYTHHVSEDPGFQRDFGVDEASQVSLSNTYACLCGIGHDKAVAIIETYRRIRREMPAGCPAEWIEMYPPFPRGFHIPPWIYTNGACTGLVAGELARACFEHGYEAYGADILDRFLDLFQVPGGIRISGLWGKRPDEPERSFQPVDLAGVANADLVCEADGSRGGWMGEPDTDMRSLPTGPGEFRGVAFDVIDPPANAGRACIRLACGREGFAESAEVPVGSAAGSMYFLHATDARSLVVGTLTVTYADGSTHRQHVLRGEHVLGFWNPAEPDIRRRIPHLAVGWAGPCPTVDRVGLAAWGWENPHPERPIDRIRLDASIDGAAWFVVGLTLSDAAPWFEPGPDGGGPPPFWNAGSVTCALAEGLAGVVDEDRNMNAVRVAPRWEAAGVREVTACLRYHEGGGYVRYAYRREDGAIRLRLAASGETQRVELLLPDGAEPRALAVNGQDRPFTLKTVESSRYACFDRTGCDAADVTLSLADAEETL